VDVYGGVLSHRPRRGEGDADALVPSEAVFAAATAPSEPAGSGQRPGGIAVGSLTSLRRMAAFALRLSAVG